MTKTINPGLYAGGMFIEAAAAIDLAPGTYYVVNGDFSVASTATVTCRTCDGTGGVTIVLTTTTASVGKVQILPGAAVSLQAPKAGSFSGLLFVQDRLAASAGITQPDNALNGGPSMNLTGLLYFPSSSVALRGNPQANCTVLIAKRIVIDGTSRLSTSGCEADGLIGLLTIYTAALAE